MRKKTIKIQRSKSYMRSKYVGNPNWGKAINLKAKLPVIPTEWDQLLKHLGLNESEKPKILTSNAIKSFVNKNRKSRYIPEWVIVSLGYDTAFLVEDL